LLGDPPAYRAIGRLRRILMLAPSPV
jgi:hypothetical protein